VKNSREQAVEPAVKFFVPMKLYPLLPDTTGTASWITMLDVRKVKCMRKAKKRLQASELAYRWKPDFIIWRDVQFENVISDGNSANRAYDLDMISAPARWLLESISARECGANGCRVTIYKPVPRICVLFIENEAVDEAYA
jgi:hypothetical protein